MMRKLCTFAFALAALGGCNRDKVEAIGPAAPTPAQAPLVQPPAPGTPGGLPDDRTAISEGPITPDSPQGAAGVLQRYFADLGAKDYIGAWALWADAGRASGSRTPDEFAAKFAGYSQYDAQVGAPGRLEGAAGSLYVTVPVVIYGRRTTGEEVHEKGEAVLRRVNDVPGATPAQRHWHIERMDLKPTGG